MQDGWLKKHHNSSWSIVSLFFPLFSLRPKGSLLRLANAKIWVHDSSKTYQKILTNHTKYEISQEIISSVKHRSQFYSVDQHLLRWPTSRPLVVPSTLQPDIFLLCSLHRVCYWTSCCLIFLCEWRFQLTAFVQLFAIFIFLLHFHRIFPWKCVV